MSREPANAVKNRSFRTDIEEGIIVLPLQFLRASAVLGSVATLVVLTGREHRTLLGQSNAARSTAGQWAGYQLVTPDAKIGSPIATFGRHKVGCVRRPATFPSDVRC
jgi:hypothetical protein